MDEKLKQRLLNCRDPILSLGPREEWGSFSFLFPQGGGCTIGDKKLAMECVQFLRDNGIEVAEYRR